MENNIKIVRFKDGLDVICKITQENLHSFVMVEPMAFAIRNSHLHIHQWLPSAVTKENKVSIKHLDVLCIFEPNDSFKEYYSNLSESLNNVVSDNDLANTNFNKIKELLEVLENSEHEEGSPLH